MLNTVNLEVEVLSYTKIEGTSKKTGKQFSCIKIDGFYNEAPTDSIRGNRRAIQIFENYTPDFDVFFSKKEPVHSFKCEGFFKDFKFNCLKITEVTI